MNKELTKTDHCIMERKISGSFYKCIDKKYIWEVKWGATYQMAQQIYKNICDDVGELLRDEMKNKI